MISAPQLKEYRRKRDFKRTPEPKGTPERAAEGRTFVVQKHDATRLHYDLRLEMGGTLKSWAVPKGPSLDPGEKRLAVRVEDHPLEYGGFEGTIPEGEYGAGSVLVWDRGRWEPLGDPDEGYRKGKLHFRLHGEKLKGGWVLVRMGGARGEDGKNWLFFKEKDKEAGKKDILKERPESVLSGRRIWGAGPAAEDGRRNGKKAPPEPAAPEKLTGRKAGRPRRRRPGMAPAGLHNARGAPPPSRLAPQLATLVPKVPEGDGWLHEIKFDGYRILCRLREGEVRLITRGGKDWTARFSGVARACAGFPAKEAILDGEVVALREDGTSDFQALQNSLKGGSDAPIVYYVFDLPYADGFDLRKSPLIERKELLRRRLESRAGMDSHLQYSQHVQGKGSEVYGHACRIGVEGVVCKKAGSEYQPKRTKTWLKVKCTRRQEFVIGGFTDPGGSRRGFGALLLGCYDGDDLVYCGKVGTGFDDALLVDLAGRLKRMERKAPSFKNPPRGPEARGAHWVRPELVGEVAFTEWTGDGSLRHPAFVGLREDKPAREVARESYGFLPGGDGRGGRSSKPKKSRKRATKKNRASAGPAKKRGTRSARKEPEETVAGVPLSNPGRVLFPEQDLTKRTLAEYYERIAEWALPHVAGRPLTLVRCPQGHAKDCFFQKHIDGPMPKGMRGMKIQEKAASGAYLVVDDLPGLISLVQLGVLEIHTWGSRADNVEKPDLLVFDLDPDPGVRWEDVIESARVTGGRLAELGLRSFVKTSGGKGLHVVAPIACRGGWEEVRSFAKAVVEDICREMPGRCAATMSKPKRKGKIFIDHFRNGRGATSVAAYSTRAKAGAPVSAPIHWDELSPRLKADAFNVQNVPRRLASLKRDPWEGFFRVRQSITSEMKKTLGMEEK
ncbi:MAG: DNA ligase D [Candidatus Tectomicrobia bacterium]|uniref:DNA ligase (ATP) n=1 Tax=Tectimicrobiota bacterium TaxID=2528274 RepID=A0A932MP68_UNCTE|nr:DNA ligase D [Candidatus Tectomicrobia bacterium]